MKIFDRAEVKLTSGYLFDKQELNRRITVDAVYDRFFDTGRIEAFKLGWKEGGENKPHIFWDSDVAKWMEGAAYILSEHPDAELEARIDAIVADVKRGQHSDGYFNIYFTVVEPDGHFTNRDRHELYCAGHLMEAAVALDKYCHKGELLECMDKYADCIYKAFISEKTAKFSTPGHEEIELALVRMYCHTGKKKYLEMAEYFINTRGAVDEQMKGSYDQSHLPVREQSEVVGHAVRAMYLYTGMAKLAKETGDKALFEACKRLWADATEKKMYVTGGLGSTYIGEAFTSAYDMPNDTAYTETCASIGLMFFANAMLALENDAKYADVIERAMYNGMMSGLSLDGKAFFYENPLEISLSEHFSLEGAGRTFKVMKRKLPITERVEVFKCSCCPPNIVRLFPSFGEYIYGCEGDTLYVNQFVSSQLSSGDVGCVMTADYPRSGSISITPEGVKRVAIRIPSWCKSFGLNKPYREEKGYAVVECDGSEIALTLDMTPRAVWADPRVRRDAGRLCIMRGPVVYCAEGVDNGENLHRFSIDADFGWTEKENEAFGLPTLEIDAYELKSTGDGLYTSSAPTKEKTRLTLIPYNCFANRGESDMLVWLRQN
ncbi:MAG: glycoside hydrolase family 127 protein [Clostridia bacterium]|nr:glycoside hydrolase family 127 protein [Clostridia bacterium]